MRRFKQHRQGSIFYVQVIKSDGNTLSCGYPLFKEKGGGHDELTHIDGEH